MALTIDDLKPKSFKVNIDGLELDCKPLRMSHALTLAKIGGVLEKGENSTHDEIAQAEKDMDKVVADLIPELDGVQLGINQLMSVMQQMMDSFKTEEEKEFEESGVKLDNSDPKDRKNG